MGVDFDRLACLTPSRSLALEEQILLARTWREKRLHPGEFLWHRGDQGGQTSILMEGELSVEAHGKCLGTIRRSDLVGACTMLEPDLPQQTSLRASGPTELLMLPRHALQTIKSELPACYGRLLGLALNSLVRRLRELDLRLTRLSQLPSNLPAGWGRANRRFPRLMSLQQQVSPGDGPPDIIVSLKQVPQLDRVCYAHLEILSCAFEACRFEASDVLMREGEEGDRAYLLAAGEVRVMRSARGRLAEPLTTLFPGEFFGALNLVQPGRRATSCVATAPGWVFAIDRADYLRMPHMVRAPFDEGLLVQLGHKLMNANAQLATLLMRERVGDVW